MLTNEISRLSDIDDFTLRAMVAQAVRRTSKPFCIFLDSLDEAGSVPATRLNAPGELLESRKIATLLRMLAHLPGVRVLVGTRRNSLEDLAGPTLDLIVDLDSDDYSVSSQQTVEYVEGLLYQNSTYRDDPSAARRVAEAITTRVRSRTSQGMEATNFLFARLCAEARWRDARPVTSQKRLERLLPTSVPEAFRQEVHARLGQEDADILLSLAWAAGQGAPVDDAWRMIAGAVTNRDITDSQIHRVRLLASDYLLVSTVADQETVQLFHQSLIDGLVASHHNRSTAVHRRIVKALQPNGSDGVRRWHEAIPYALRHIADHAISAKVLNDLIQDPFFLIAADANSLRRVSFDQCATDSERAAIAAYHMTGNQWRYDDPSHRFWWLHVNSRKTGADVLAERAGAVSRSIWQISHCWWAGRIHRSFYSYARVPTAAAIGVVEQREAIVIGSFDGSVRVLDVETGQLLRQLDNHSWSVSSVMVSEGLIVTSGGFTDGVIRIWDSVSGKLQHELPGHNDGTDALAVVFVEGRRMLVSGGRDEFLRVWDVGTGEQVHEIGVGKPIYALATKASRVGSIVAFQAGGTLGYLDAETMITQELGSANGIVRCIAVGEVSGEEVVLAGVQGHGIQIWSIKSKNPMAPLTDDYRIVKTITFAQVMGRSVLLGGGDGGHIRIWDAETKTSLGGLFGGPEGAVAVDVVSMRNKELIVSAHVDGTVRVWEPELSSADPGEGIEAFWAIASRESTIVQSNEAVYCWRPFHGEEKPRKLNNTVNDYGAVVGIAPIREGTMVISMNREGLVRAWDINSTAVFRIMRLPVDANWGPQVTVSRLGRSYKLVSVDESGLVGIWSLESGRLLRTIQLDGSSEALGPKWEFNANHISVLAISVGKIANNNVLVTVGGSGGLRLWNLDTGAPERDLAGHVFESEIISAGRQQAEPTQDWGMVEAAAVGVIDGREVIVTVGDHGIAKIWDGAT